MRPGTKPWTPEEDGILAKEALAGSPPTEIASKLGRTESAVRTRAYVLRVLLRSANIKRRGSAW